MKNILKIVVVFVLTIVGSSLIYCVVSKGQSVYRNDFKKYSEMFEDTTRYDAVIIGSSRAYKNIDPVICDSITGLSFYNAGVAGAKYFEISMVFSAYFNVHKAYPDYIIYDLDELYFGTDKDFFNPILYLNFLDNPVVYEGFSEKEHSAWLYKNLPFTRMLEYNDDARNNAVKGLSGYVNPEDVTIKGYSRMHFNKFKPMKTNLMGASRERTYKENERFTEMMDFCSTNKIQMIFVSSPVYDDYYHKKVSNYEVLMKDFEKYASEMKCPLWRFDTISICKDEQFFGDNVHLNRKGTDLFSSMLAVRIKAFVGHKSD